MNLILGLGKTGISIAHYLHKRNEHFIMYDTREEVPFIEKFTTQFPYTEIFLKELPNIIYKNITRIISSPGISLKHPILQKAMTNNIPIIGDIECLAQEINAPIIAITGTNGKSTVTTLVGEIAKSSLNKVAVGGNIGTPVLELLDDENTYDIWILELSSFQLDLVYSLTPIAATILNITEDHLDRHKNMENYINAKHKIYNFSKYLLYNRDDINTKPKKVTSQQKVASFGLDVPLDKNWGFIKYKGETHLAQGNKPLFSVNKLNIYGKHNWQNALVAFALSAQAGISFEKITDTLTKFQGLAHRCEKIRTLNKITWINDSKGTNVGATYSALTGIGAEITGKIVLIAGGISKDASFNKLRNPILKYVRILILIGRDAQKIAQDVHGTVPILYASSLNEAIILAKSHAKIQDVVLLSPACSSFDMFIDFNHRGEEFRKIVNTL